MIRKRKAGQGVAEYGLIIALIAIAAILALTLLGNTTSQVFSNVICDIQGAVPSVFTTSPCAHVTGINPSPVPTPPIGYVAAVKADAPSAYWRLDETGVINGSIAKDEIPQDGSAGPNGADPGTYNASPATCCVPAGTVQSGISPSAIVNGVNRGTNVTFGAGGNMSANSLSALQGTQPRSIEVWFNNSNIMPGDVPSTQNIFETGVAGNGTQMVITLVNGGSSQCCLDAADVNYARYSAQAIRVSFGSGSGYQVLFPRMNFADAKWHYLVVTLNGAVVNLYVDGVQPMGYIAGNDGTNGGNDMMVKQPITLAFTPNTATPLVTTPPIGLDWGGNRLGNGPFVGAMDEAAVYNFVLSPLQIATHYTAGVGPLLLQPSTNYSNATFSGDSSNGCLAVRVTANTCGPVAYWRLGDTGAPGHGFVAQDAMGNDPGLYFGGTNWNSGVYPIGTYAQSNSSGTGGTANSSTFDAGNSDIVSGSNATGSGVLAGGLETLLGNHARTIKLWFQTSSPADYQTIFETIRFQPRFGGTNYNSFGVRLLTPAGANNEFGGIGGPPPALNTYGGFSIIGANVFIPAPYNLADGHWHYLALTVGEDNTASNNMRVWVDDVQMSGIACCPGNTWTGVMKDPIVIQGTLVGSNSAITIGYAMQPPRGFGPSNLDVPTLWEWFKGQIQDVAVYDYALNVQQISHEWGQAHPTATCQNLLMSNASGNADGGIFGRNNGPVSVVATQDCVTVGSVYPTGTIPGSVPNDRSIILADPYVTFYYAWEKHKDPNASTHNSPACYSGLSSRSQIPWITGAGPWVYCYPGGYPAADLSLQQTFPYTVTTRIGSSATLTPCTGTPFPGGQTVCFYQGQILTPCTVVDANGNIDPLYFIEAQNAYSVASPVPSDTGIPLNAAQAAAPGGTINGVPTGIEHTLAVTENQNGTAMTKATNGGLSSTAAWGVTGPTQYSRSVGQCVPAPGEQLLDMSYPAPRPWGGDVTPDGWANWAESPSPYILLTPSSSAIFTGTSQGYTATAYKANGEFAVGGSAAASDVTASTVLTITGGGTCDNVAKTCSATTAGDHTVTGTYGSEQGSATLTITTTLTYDQSVRANNPLLYYQLEGGSPFTDSGSLGHPATDFSSNITTGVTGAVVNGVSFASSDRLMTVTAAGLPTTGPRSVEMWVNTTDAGNRNLFSYGNWGVTGAYFSLELNETCVGCIYFRTFGNTDLVVGANINDGKWHLIDVTYDGSTIRIYKDGGLLGSVADAGLNTNLSGALRIGPDAIRSGYIGSLDDFAFYGSQLTAAQIATHFQSSPFKSASTPGTTYSAAVLANGPLSYYRLEGASPFIDSGSIGSLSVDGYGNLTTGVAGADGKGVTGASGVGIAYDPAGLPTTGPRTVEMWVNTTDAGNHNLFSYGAWGVTGGYFSLEVNETCVGCIYFRTSGNTDLVVNANINDGKWHLLDVTYDGSTIRLYKDGALVGNVANSGFNTSLTAGPMYVGHADAIRSAYVGSMDEFAVYGTALSGAQIAGHLQASQFGSNALSNTPYSNAVLASSPNVYYRFGEANYTYINYGGAGASATGTAQYDRVTSVAGLDGQGLSNAGNDGILFDSNALPSGARTIEMWLKTTDGGRHNLLYYGSGLGANGWLMEIGNSGAGSLRLYTNNGDYNWSAIGLADGNWHLIDVTYNGSGTLVVYKDGKVYDTINIGVINTTLGGVGNLFSWSPYASPYIGTTDEVAIYNTALSSGAVTTNYCSATGIACYITLAPASSAQSPNAPVTYTATAHAGATNYGTVAATLSISPNGGATGATCNNVAHTCQASAVGTYTVTASANLGGTVTATSSLVVTTGTLSYSQIVSNDLPVAYWRLGEASGTSALDASGNANTGTYFSGGMTGAPSLLSGPLESGDTAATFSGSNYVSVVSSASLTTGSAITMEAWIKTANANQSPIIEYNNGTGTGPGGSPWGVHMWVNCPGAGQICVNFVDTSGNSHSTQTLGGVIATGTIYHVVVTYGVVTTGDTSPNCGIGVSCGRVYINGILSVDSNLGIFAIQTSFPLRLGSRASGGGSTNFLAGVEDEVAIYNYALTAAQISTHYAARNN